MHGAVGRALIPLLDVCLRDWVVNMQCARVRPRDVCCPQVLACMVFTSMGVTAMMLGRRPSDPVSRILAGLVAAGCMLPCRIVLPRLYKSANAPLEEKELLLTVTDVHAQQQQQQQRNNSASIERQRPQQRDSSDWTAQHGSQASKVPPSRSSVASSSGHHRDRDRDDGSRRAKRSTAGTNSANHSAAVVPDRGNQSQKVAQKGDEVRHPLGTGPAPMTALGMNDIGAASFCSADSQSSGGPLSVEDRRLRIQSVVRVRVQSPCGPGWVASIAALRRYLSGGKLGGSWVTSGPPLGPLRRCMLPIANAGSKRGPFWTVSTELVLCGSIQHVDVQQRPVLSLSDQGLSGHG